MNKQNQSLVDFLQTMPLSSFVIQRSPISNKEAQTLYNIWLHGKKDEYGKNILPEDVDAIQVASLTSKGYIQNQPSRFAANNFINRTCEFTNKGKDVIQKIILYKEKSSFDKSSSRHIDFEVICRSAEIAELASEGKTASLNVYHKLNWFEKLVLCELNYGSNLKINKTSN